MSPEEKIKLAQLEQQLHVIKATNPNRYNSIMKSYEEIKTIKENQELFKSFSADLKAKHPDGDWRTINGAHVFIAGGKVVAGLDGFNKHIDELHSKDKKKESKGVNKQSGKKSLDEKIKIYEDKLKNTQSYKDVPVSVYNEWKEDLAKLKKQKEKQSKTTPTNERSQKEISFRDFIKNNGINAVNKNLKIKYKGKPIVLDEGQIKAKQKNKDKSYLEDAFYGADEKGDTGIYYTNELTVETKEKQPKKEDKTPNLPKPTGDVAKIISQALKTEKEVQKQIKDSENQGKDFKPNKRQGNIESKKYNESVKLGKTDLDNESSKSIDVLQKVASKIDDKYLSQKTKDSILQARLLIGDDFNDYGSVPERFTKELQETKDLAGSLGVAKKLNNFLNKTEGSYVIEKETINKIQNTLVEAIKEQSKKKATESLNYKLF